MKKKEVLATIDKLALWWLDENVPLEKSEVDVGFNIECASDGSVSAGFILKPGKEQDLAAVLFSLTNGALTTAIIEEIGKQLGPEVMGKVYDYMTQMNVESEFEDEDIPDELRAVLTEMEEGSEDEPIIKPSEVFKEQ